MTNQELYNILIEIMHKNPLDAYCELKQLNREYKRSIFYKKTKLPLKSVYELVCASAYMQLYTKLRELVDTQHWAVKIENFIDDLDENTIRSFFNKLLDSFQLNNLTNEKGELTGLLDQMKTLG